MSSFQQGRSRHFDTLAVHAGQEPDPSTGAVMGPIYTTSTYRQRSPGVHQGFEYSRSQNPTRFALERCLAELEGGQAGFTFASGLAAMSTLLELVDSGGHIVAGDDLYGGTYRLFERVRQRSAGLRVSYVDATDIDALERALRPETRMIWVESPTNPLLKVVDLSAVAALGEKHDVLTVCDNTFATPYVQRPLELGFDVVVHSLTKYLNGNSAVIGGALVVNDIDLGDSLRFLQNAVGAVLGPFDAFMVHRGIKTLSLRMERQCASALELARWLELQPWVESVRYPGLPSHPQHALASRQMRAYGGMVSCVIEGGVERARRFLEHCEVFTLAESLGGVESLIEHPGIMTHASIPAERREELGIAEGLIRLSVGIEALDDLRADLEAAAAASV